MLKIFSLFTVAVQSLVRKKKRSNQTIFLQRVPILASVEINALLGSGIKGIILDLDNTIVSEDDRYLSPGAETWIDQAKLQGLKFYILSNGKRRHRLIYWCERLEISGINPARKPFPFAFAKAFKHMGLKASQVMVIGDSFHTDIMGAFLSGCTCIQVASLPHPPRWWEKIIGRWVQRPYPSDRELWKFEKDFRAYF
ncbi:MAG: YqeG family HAD IIIA-type phosphatase [Hydrococcus sp. RM1_1_31]|nr:YqeG family HAD IIIA-type phosphatase [Hydrococcus sp. RM1_1_31]